MRDLASSWREWGDSQGRAGEYEVEAAIQQCAQELEERLSRGPTQSQIDLAARELARVECDDPDLYFAGCKNCLCRHRAKAMLTAAWEG